MGYVTHRNWNRKTEQVRFNKLISDANSRTLLLAQRPSTIVVLRRLPACRGTTPKPSERKHLWALPEESRPR